MEGYKYENQRSAPAGSHRIISAAGNRDEIIERLISLHEKAGTFSGNGSRRN